MPDAIDGAAALAAAPREQLTRTAYNVAAFNPTAEEICDVVVAAFPGARITWDDRREAAGASSTRGRRTSTTRRAPRLGLRAALRFPRARSTNT